MYKSETNLNLFARYEPIKTVIFMEEKIFFYYCFEKMFKNIPQLRLL